MQGEKARVTDKLQGYIFLCNGRTKPECFRYRVFGLPASRLEVIAKIKPKTKLFLFDFDLKLLYGVYVAASDGTMALEPYAFGGKFPAQVRFEILKDCMPLPESAFKPVIKDNYDGGFKFRQELSEEQVSNLITLFRPLAAPSSASLAPLFQNAVSPLEILSSGIEKAARLPAEPPLPDGQLVRIRSIDRQPYSEPYHQVVADQPYVPEHLPLQDPYSRCNSLPKNAATEIVSESTARHDWYSYNQNGALAATNTPAQAHAPVLLQTPAPSQNSMHSSSYSLAAAYWTAVASGASDQVHSNPHQRVASYSTSIGGENVSFPPLHELARLPSSYLLAAYWAAVASEASNQGYSAPRHELPSGSTVLEGDNASVSIAGMAASVQAHAPVPSQF